MSERMVTFKGREEIIGTDAYLELDKRYGV